MSSPVLKNQAMARKLSKGEALDVRAIGTEVEPGVFELQSFTEDVDYCDAQTEAWIWSVGRRQADGQLLAATDARFYERPGYECLWLR